MTKLDQISYVLKSFEKSFERSLRSFIRRHDDSRFIRRTIRFFTRTLYRFYRPFDPWSRDKLHINPSPTHQSDRIPYIIRTRVDRSGLFAYFATILGGIAYAERKGYVPIVDMKNYHNSYLYDSEVGKVNAWEYYFTQPDTLTLEEALSCKEYIIGRETALNNRPFHSTSVFYNQNGELDYWRRLCKKYIHFTQPVIDGVKRELQKFAGKKVLGVSTRGTDYTELKPSCHQVQPTIEQAISKTREVMSAGKYDAVYLTTEDKNIIAAFKEEFGEKLILSDRDPIDFDARDGKWLTELTYDRRENDKYLTGLEYLVSILMAAKCDGLITSLTCGSTGIMLFSEGFEYLYVFDLGFYP